MAEYIKKIHFIGIGGIGMSAIAGICVSNGDKVSGSDLRLSNLTQQLAKSGALIHEGHDASNIAKDTDIVVKSTCIRNDNPEIIQAVRLGINVVSRGQMLRSIIDKASFSVGITGTHGKTTTTGLISHVLAYCEKDPTVLIGGEVDSFNGNFKLGHSGMVVAEIDESDGYFRNIKVSAGIVTNIEREHIENYGSMDNLVEAYKEFVNRIDECGFCVYNGEDKILDGIIKKSLCKSISFGIDKKFDICAHNYTYAKNIEFDLSAYGSVLGRVKSSLIGRYNLMNILAVVAVGLEIKLDFVQIAEGIASFKGVKRRFDTVGEFDGIKIIEDYAHHPTEINAVITAAKNYSLGRVVSVFQPHRYSRTKDLMKELTNCFYSADILILTDIYSADEEKKKDINARSIYETLDKTRFEQALFLEKEDIPELISGIVKKDDIILVLGAGDIKDISLEIVREIRNSRID
ncbi:MAG: UDP-N-acetylmuramate--L-alanine ligase [Candidatus Omnitrophota bacterium]